jgi:catechol 2,3-dioxygenase-like lactoylglutathione lyase family enzyme
MRAVLYHVQVNVGRAERSLPFYRALLTYLELRPVYEDARCVGFSDGAVDVWLIETDERHAGFGFHRKRTGLNHLAFRVDTRGAVDRFAREFLQPRGIATLYGTPREFPEYGPGYYAVFFEDPDRLKLEVAHVPGRPEAPHG